MKNNHVACCPAGLIGFPKVKSNKSGNPRVCDPLIHGLEKQPDNRKSQIKIDWWWHDMRETERGRSKFIMSCLRVPRLWWDNRHWPEARWWWRTWQESSCSSKERQLYNCAEENKARLQYHFCCSRKNPLLKNYWTSFRTKFALIQHQQLKGEKVTWAGIFVHFLDNLTIAVASISPNP